MISRLKGRIEDKSASSVVVMAGGVGYEVFIPLSTFYDLPEVGQEVTLHVKTVLREDALELFGFLTQAEKETWLMLNGVSKIGPRLALNVLSGIGPAELVAAITTKNLARLSSVPGVGTKTAERLVVELKDKIVRLAGLAGPIQPEPRPVPFSEVDRDVISALLNLGYGRGEAEKAALAARYEAGDGETDLALLLRLSLKKLKKV
ncbi:MAG: Holliday junction branch migration protein RuvA [Thermodesulfobacteriota bacterium]